MLHIFFPILRLDPLRIQVSITIIVTFWNYIRKKFNPNKNCYNNKNNVEIKIIGDNLDDVNIKNIYYFFSQLETKGMGEIIVRKLYENNIMAV